MNRRVFEHSRRVIVHSPWCVGRLEGRHPELADRAVVIPLGSRARAVSAHRKAEIRDRFEIARDATVLAAFGFIHPDKMNPEALRAFHALAADNPKAILILVGQEVDGGELRRETIERGLMGRVRFLGRQSLADFDDLAAISDVGFSLRRPPTNGETSAGLLHLLGFGVATIVTDVATFADFPDAAVRKVRWEADGQDGLDRAARDLVEDIEARRTPGPSRVGARRSRARLVQGRRPLHRRHRALPRRRRLIPPRREHRARRLRPPASAIQELGQEPRR